jgi:selenocysteine lyase/cysteine desulfurase
MRTRRSFLGTVVGGGAATALGPSARIGLSKSVGKTVERKDPPATARDEEYWRGIRRAFDVDDTLINLNNGGVSPSPRAVQDALFRQLELSNQAPAHTMWEVLEPQVETVRARLAASLGCDAEELAIVRNASEALETCILGLELKPGDEVVTTNQDYPRMLDAWRQRERRDGIVLKAISFPTPPSDLEDLLEGFRRALTRRTRAILVCHMTNLTGQIFPVRELCRLARERGIEAIVDGAQAYAQVPFSLSDLDCDYYGASLHKWLMAPVGTGFLYVRREKIARLWPLMAAPAGMEANIRKFEEIGTHPAANHNAILEALDFHQRIGAERKAVRLRYLRDRWMTRLQDLPGVRFHTSLDPNMGCAIGTVEIEGVDPAPLVKRLWQRRRILATPILHREFRGLRVTPGIYTTLEELDAFAEEMGRVVAGGLES